MPDKKVASRKVASDDEVMRENGIEDITDNVCRDYCDSEHYLKTQIASALRAKNKRILELERIVVVEVSNTKDAKIAKLKKDIEIYEEGLAGFREIVDKKCLEIAKLKEKISHYVMGGDYHLKWMEAQGEIAKLKDVLQATEDTLHRKEAEIAKKQKIIASQERQLKNMEYFRKDKDRANKEARNKIIELEHAIVHLKQRPTIKPYEGKPITINMGGAMRTVDKMTIDGKNRVIAQLLDKDTEHQRKIVELDAENNNLQCKSKDQQRMIAELEKKLDDANVIWREGDVRRFVRNLNKPNKKAQRTIKRAMKIFGKIKKGD